MQQVDVGVRDAGALERQRARLARGDVEEVAPADAVVLHRLGAAEDDAPAASRRSRARSAR